MFKNRKAVFVVGLPRSGTTLLVRILNQNPEVAISPETHFFGSGKNPAYQLRYLFNRRTYPFSRAVSPFRKELDAVLNASADGLENRLAKLIAAGNGPYWSWINERQTAARFIENFLKSSLTERDFLFQLMVHFAGESQVIGEKTPQHLYFVPVLMRWFPDGNVIQIIRHPCAVFYSTKRFIVMPKPYFDQPFRRSVLKYFDLFLAAKIGMNWNRAVRLHNYYSKRYPGQYSLVSYQDLVTNSEISVKRICTTLDLKFMPEMLSPPGRHNSSVVSKDQQLNGITTVSLTAWKENISPLAARIILALTKGGREQLEIT